MIVNKRLQDHSVEKGCVFTDDPGKTDYPLKKNTKLQPNLIACKRITLKWIIHLKGKNLKPQFLFDK